MSVTFFQNGLEVSDDAALRANTFCENVMLKIYKRNNNGEYPPGWPSQAARKFLIEWSIKFIFSREVRDYERDEAIKNIVTNPWEGAG